MESGQDSLGNVYLSIERMWKQEVKDKRNWYFNANSYWSRQTSDMQGVMGGLPEIHPADIEGSSSFLERVHQNFPFSHSTALDCGCGIGRVTKYFLSNIFDKVDLVDQCESYINQAMQDLSSLSKPLKRLKSANNADQCESFEENKEKTEENKEKTEENQDEERFRFIVAGLQEFSPSPGFYDVIWIQWVLSHLTDDDLLAFFDRVAKGLKPGGIVFIKENIKKTGFMVHKDDFSVTRSEKLLKSLICQKFRILDEQMQTGFPENLFKVKMFACNPKLP
jgi:protein N-terminal methyltransferase